MVTEAERVEAPTERIECPPVEFVTAEEAYLSAAEVAKLIEAHQDVLANLIVDEEVLVGHMPALRAEAIKRHDQSVLLGRQVAGVTLADLKAAEHWLQQTREGKRRTRYAIAGLENRRTACLNAARQLRGWRP